MGRGEIARISGQVGSKFGDFNALRRERYILFLIINLLLF